MAKVTSLNVNGKKLTVDVDSTVSLLAVLRNDLDLTGSKYGCGEGQCGACTVLLDGVATRSCITQVGRAAGKQITTIEGLGERWQAASAAGSFHQGRRDAMRLLHFGNDHVGERAADQEPKAESRRDHYRHERQHLPLRNLSANRRRDSNCLGSRRAGRQGR